MILAGIRVGDGNRAGCGQIAGDDAGVFGDVVYCRGADHRGVVGAMDGEADGLGGAVGRRHREGVDMGAGAAIGIGAGEELYGAVGDRIGVAAVGGQAEAAEIAGAVRHGGVEVTLAGVDIADRDRAGRGQRHRRVARAVFGDVVNRRAADHSGVVGTEDGDADVLSHAVVVLGGGGGETVAGGAPGGDDVEGGSSTIG